MDRRIFAPPLLPALLTAGNASVPADWPIRQGSPGIRPVIARPHLARHGGGGGGHGGGGHGGHHGGGVIYGAGPGYHDSGGGGNGGGRGAIIFSLGYLALFLTGMILLALHEYAALMVLMVLMFGLPLAGITLLFLVVLVARCLGWAKRPSSPTN
jgi:hypothetical protein